MAHGQTFLPVDLKRRISQKVLRGGPDRTPLPGGEGDARGGEGRRQLPEVGLEASPVPQLLVDVSGVVAAINERARTLFGLRPGDVGRPLRDLQISYRPADLRSLIDQATAERRPIAVKEVEWRTPSGESSLAGCAGRPAQRRVAGELGVLIAYSDVTGYRRLTRELEQSPTGSWRRLTRSCSPPTRSWRPPTRSSSPRWRSWRPPMRSSSPPTRSSRR